MGRLFGHPHPQVRLFGSTDGAVAYKANAQQDGQQAQLDVRDVWEIAHHCAFAIENILRLYVIAAPNFNLNGIVHGGIITNQLLIQLTINVIRGNDLSLLINNNTRHKKAALAQYNFLSNKGLAGTILFSILNKINDAIGYGRPGAQIIGNFQQVAANFVLLRTAGVFNPFSPKFYTRPFLLQYTIN